jgi:gliding motility-associated-like protein
MIGNTLNPMENSFQSQPDILSSSSAFLQLNENQTILNAYLYWSGSGTGDFEVTLNGQPISSTRTFLHERVFPNGIFNYFSGFADVTNLIQSTGNGAYVFANLDISAHLPLHFTRRTNYAGWAIVIVYEDPMLPLNQINLYDGLQGVPTNLSIELSSLNVLDNENSKIGFLAWEGDSNIAVNESLKFNGNVLSNPPLNPATNAFNGTNSFTHSSDLYNMDLDVYLIEDFLQPGDETALIELTSGQDFILVNAVLTKLNNQLPDATIFLQAPQLVCDSKEITINYEVRNWNATNVLPAPTPISFYANNQLIATTTTLFDIPINGTESGSITILIPNDMPNPIELKAMVDDIGNGIGIINELVENNNDFIISFQLISSPIVQEIAPLKSCNVGFGKGIFNLNEITASLLLTSTQNVSFYYNEQDAITKQNQIQTWENFEIISPATIYFRLEEGICFSVGNVTLQTKNCPPIVYNYISDNNDGINDVFHIKGLRDIFLQHEIYLYDRWGSLIWKGNQNTPEWSGITTKGYLPRGNQSPKRSTYFYIIYLNDPDYPEPLTGYLFYQRLE